MNEAILVLLIPCPHFVPGAFALVSPKHPPERAEMAPDGGGFHLLTSPIHPRKDEIIENQGFIMV